MQLLFDENLSFRLPGLIADLYPGSAHVRTLGLLGASDERIWDYAAAQGYSIVSKDADFYQRSLVYGPPPRVVWLRIGNAPTARIAALLRARHPVLVRFEQDAQATFLPLHFGE